MASFSWVNAQRVVRGLHFKLHTYAGVFYHLKQMAKGQIYIENDEFGRLIYEANTDGSGLVVRLVGGDRPFSVCPYPQCEKFTDEMEVCEHALEERFKMYDSYFYPKRVIVKQGGVITPQGIKSILNYAAAMTGILNRSDKESHVKMCNRVGENMLQTKSKLQVFQVMPHSKSLIITDVDASFRVYTCGEAGCNNPAAPEMYTSRFCMDHYVLKPDKKDTRPGAKRELGAMAAIWKKEGLGGGNSTYPVVTAKEFDNMERNQKNSVIQSWVELYGFLYRLGEKGYFIEMEDDVFLFTTSEDGRFSAFVGTQINKMTTRWRCIYPGCLARTLGTDHYCKNHKDETNSIFKKNMLNTEDLQYGCNAKVFMTIADPRMGNTP